MKFDTLININVSLNIGKRDGISYTRNVFFTKETRALTPIMRPFVFIQLSTRRVPAGIEARQGIVIPQGFMGNLGASSSPARDGGERRGKLKMSIKSIKSETQGRLPWNILRQRGNSFSYAISISCFASSPRPPPRSPRPSVPTLAATNLRSIRVSSLKTVNSARHQGECELAPAVLSVPIKMTMKKTGPDRSVVSAASLLVLPIESYLNGSYTLIDPFLASFP